jgi:hypothetical protein
LTKRKRNVKNFVVSSCERNDIKDFIEKWHYSKNMNGIISTYCFKLEDKGELIGAMVFGWLAMANTWKKYVDKREELIELRRLCCIDDTPKNTESFFIGKCLRWMKNNTEIRKIVSYADAEFNHQGIIYQATNFKKLGMTSKGRVIIWKGKRYHDKTIRTYYNGKLKPFAIKVKEALDTGKAKYKKTKGKHIYLYTLRKKW